MASQCERSEITYTNKKTKNKKTFNILDLNATVGGFLANEYRDCGDF